MATVGDRHVVISLHRRHRTHADRLLPLAKVRRPRDRPVQEQLLDFLFEQANFDHLSIPASVAAGCVWIGRHAHSSGSGVTGSVSGFDSAIVPRARPGVKSAPLADPIDAAWLDQMMPALRTPLAG